MELSSHLNSLIPLLQNHSSKYVTKRRMEKTLYKLVILTILALTLVSTRNSCSKTLAISFVTMCFPTSASGLVYTLLHITLASNAYSFIHMTVKTMRVFGQHLLDGFFAIFFVFWIVVTVDTKAVRTAEPFGLKTLTV